MYAESETEISQAYLKQVIECIEGPVVILGGWAVQFLVNEGYREITGRNYLGSRDIDLGFFMEGQNVDDTPFAKAYSVLVNELGFRPLSFRLFREMHAETGEPLDMATARDLPSHQIFHVYVDMVLDRIPENFREHFGFTPIDEPLLAHVFAEEGRHLEREEFGKTIWIPTADILLAMKVRTLPDRDKEHKRIKDVCDIAALTLFGSMPREEGWLEELIGKEDIDRFKEVLTREDIERASEIIAIEPVAVEGALTRIGLA